MKNEVHNKRCTGTVSRLTQHDAANFIAASQRCTATATDPAIIHVCAVAAAVLHLNRPAISAFESDVQATDPLIGNNNIASPFAPKCRFGFEKPMHTASVNRNQEETILRLSRGCRVRKWKRRECLSRGGQSA
mmetsp:Transcript_6317/g.19874  ORF Transcript_6317/g.19874 Transcript_6317/m.19874 type:complete len:133 (-) Transcript_6317:40-438(-)